MKNSVWMATFLSLVLCSLQALCGEVRLDVKINTTPVCNVHAYMGNMALMPIKSSYSIDNFIVSVTPDTRRVGIQVSHLGTPKLNASISLEKWNQQRMPTDTTMTYRLDDSNLLTLTVTDTRTERERLGNLHDNME